MIKKKRNCRLLSLAVGLLLIFSALSLSGYGKNKPGKISITLSSLSEYQKAKIKLNGVYKGYIYRNRTKTFLIPIPRQKISQRVRIEIYNGRDRIIRKTAVIMARQKRIRLTLKKTQSRFGKIKVTLRRESTVRRARLYINGDAKGEIRRGQQKNFRLKKGIYNIRLRSGRISRSKKIMLQSGDAKDAFFTLKKKKRSRYGSIKIGMTRRSTVRTASIYINNSFKGKIARGQFKEIRVKAGEYTVKLKKGRISQSTTVTVRKRKTAVASFTLKRRTRYGYIKIKLMRSSTIPRAQFYINNRYKGTIRRGGTEKILLKAGEYTVELRSGNLSRTKTVQVRRKRTASASFIMRRRVRKVTLKIRLAFASDTKRARLYIDGRYRKLIRKGSDYRFRLKKGTHSIQVKSGDLEQSKTIRLIRRAKTIRFHLKMQLGTLRIRINRRSRASRVKVYINNTYKGRLRRGVFRSFRLKTGGGKLTLRALGKTLRKSFTIGSARTTSLSILFPKPEKGKLIITHSRMSRYRRGRLYINGRYEKTLRRGKSATIIKKAGIYKISMRYRTKRINRTVVLNADSTKDIVLRFKRRNRRYGYIAVTYPEDSRYESVKLYVGNRFYGTLWQGDSKRIRTRSGSTKIQIKASGRTKSQLVTIRRGQTTTVTLRFRQKSRMGRIRVYHSRTSRKNLGTVYINGRRRGILRKGKGKSFQIRAGRHTVTLKRGREKTSRRLRVRAGRTSFVSLRLGRTSSLKEKGTLLISLKGSFRWAKVYINKKYRGRVLRNKALRIRLSAGKRYTLRVSRDDMKSSATRRVFLSAESIKKVPFTLIFSE